MWCGKHKGYIWKSKVAVGPDGKDWYVYPPYPGLFHNIKIFKAHIEEHLASLIKNNLDMKESKNMSFDNNNNNKNMWAVFFDKGYKGFYKYGMFLTPKKKTACRDLDSENKKKHQNQKQQSCF